MIVIFYSAAHNLPRVNICPIFNFDVFFGLDDFHYCPFWRFFIFIQFWLSFYSFVLFSILTIFLGNAPGDWDRVATEFPELVKRVKCAHHDLRCLTNCFELNQQNQELNPMKMVDLRPNMPIRIWNEDSGQWVHETNTQHSRT